jgi:hypothetical protein
MPDANDNEAKKESIMLTVNTVSNPRDKINRRVQQEDIYDDPVDDRERVKKAALPLK